DESNDRIRVTTLDGTALAPGKTVRVEATVWAYGGVSSGQPRPFYPAHPQTPALAVIAPPPPPPAGGGRGSPPHPRPPPRVPPVRPPGRGPPGGPRELPLGRRRVVVLGGRVRRPRRPGVLAAVTPARRTD